MEQKRNGLEIDPWNLTSVWVWLRNDRKRDQEKLNFTVNGVGKIGWPSGKSFICTSHSTSGWTPYLLDVM